MLLGSAVGTFRALKLDFENIRTTAARRSVCASSLEMDVIQHLTLRGGYLQSWQAWDVGGDMLQRFTLIDPSLQIRTVVYSTGWNENILSCLNLSISAVPG